jgi:hypothetical protein
LPSNGNPTKPPRLRIVEDLATPVEKNASDGSGTPSPLPSGVQVLEGDVLYREWVRGPSGALWVVPFFAGLAVAIGFGWVAVNRAPGLAGIASSGGALLAIAVAFTAWNFRHLYLQVDGRGLAWRFGLFGRRYSLEEVSMFRERVFHFPKVSGVGGWGIGQAKDGMDTYEVWGANGTALDVVVTRGAVTRHFLLSTAAPDRLVVQLVRAMERRVPR